MEKLDMPTSIKTGKNPVLFFNSNVVGTCGDCHTEMTRCICGRCGRKVCLSCRQNHISTHRLIDDVMRHQASHERFYAIAMYISLAMLFVTLAAGAIVWITFG